jgi:hypothetical protein
VLIPARDEAHSIVECLRSVVSQEGLGDLEVIVLDDGSTDGTGDLVRAFSGQRVRLVEGSEPPEGWLGKPWACDQLARHASGDVLAFVDADVRLTPDALRRTVALLDGAALDVVSPYPRQLAVGPAERLVQPLLQWSILSLLPLRLAESPRFPALAAGNGQLLVVARPAYDRAGGHAAVRAEVVEDVALVRAVKRAGGRGGVVDGTAIATCRMYDGWPRVRDGYAKSLRTVSPLALAALAAVNLLPPLAMVLARSRAGAIGYAAAVAGRVITGRRTRGRVLPDAAAHPVSVAVVAWIAADGRRRHRRGTLRWKGRPLP